MNDILKRGLSIRPSTLQSALMRGLTSSRPTRRSGGRLYASSAGSCARRNTMHATESGDSTMNAAGQIYATIGTAVHEVIQSALAEQGVALYNEYHLPEIELSDGTKLNLGGYVDVIGFVDGKLTCIELKTCGNLPTSPRPSHKLQAMIYSVITGLPGLVFYQARSVANFNGELHQRWFDVVPTPEDKIAAAHKLVLSSMLNSRGLIAPMPDVSKSWCNKHYCPFVHRCHGTTPVDGTEVAPEDYLELSQMALEEAQRLIDNTPKRRNGILKFMQTYGLEPAKAKLDGDWSEFLPSDE